MNLVFGLPYLIAVVAGALVCLLAGPKGPASRTWRVPAVVGFGLLAVQHLVQTGQTMLLYTGFGPGRYYQSGLYPAISLLGAILTVAGLVLLAVAVVRGRGAAAPAPLGGWGPQGVLAQQPPGPGAPPVVTADNPYGQRRQQAPQQQPSTGGGEHPEQP